MGLSAPLADSNTSNYSETPNCHQNLEMILLKCFQGIQQMGLNSPLADSYTNNFSKTPNCHQNLETIVLKNCKGSTQFSLVPLFPTLKPTIIQKHQTIIKTFRWLTWKTEKYELNGP